MPDPTTPSPAPGRLGTFRRRDFRLFWSGQLLSLIGTWMQSVGQSWLVLELTGSPFQLGLVNTLQFTPILLLSAVDGALSDRLGKRRILLVTQRRGAELRGLQRRAHRGAGGGRPPHRPLRAAAPLAATQDRFCYAEIFYAGETVARDVSSSMLADDLPPAVACGHAPDHASAVAWVTVTARPGDTALIMGARDPALPALARSILAALESLKGRAGAPGTPPDRSPRTR
jgi:MFS family permease